MSADPRHRELAPLLLAWWQRHGRKDLPWQQDPTPYRVWVSEIMLQQTQVATVARYYDRFMARFPSVIELAAAPLDEVLHQWSGLGYYARARNMHRAACLVAKTTAQSFPKNFDELVALPGIGRSTAGAILALACDQAHAILDGNVKRVLARVFNVQGWPGKSTVARELWAHAESCTPAKQAANYTQAIMDLGASLCRRSKPACADCPLQTICTAYARGCQEELPGRAPKRQRPQRSTAVFVVLRNDGRVLLHKRPSEGIWGGLWGLPEAGKPEEAAEFCTQQLGMSPVKLDVRPAIAHGFTHFDLSMTPVVVRVDSAPNRVMETDQWLWYNLRDPDKVGLAAPVSRLLKEIGAEL